MCTADLNRPQYGKAPALPKPYIPPDILAAATAEHKLGQQAMNGTNSRPDNGLNALLDNKSGGAPQSPQAFQSAQPSQPSQPPESSWQRGLGLGTRDAIEGTVGLADFAATPVRALMNRVNADFGGDPNYFKPAAKVIPDTLGLPKPETPGEEVASAVRQGLSTLPSGWGAGMKMAQQAQKTVSAVPTLTQAAGRMLTATPKTDVAATVGAATLGTLAAQQGAGPLGAMAAALGGGAAAGAAGARAARVAGGTAARGAGTWSPSTVDDAATAAARAPGGPLVETQGRTGAASVEAKLKEIDFTDYRTDDEMRNLHQKLQRITPKAEDYLYTLRQAKVASSYAQTERLAGHLARDLGVISKPYEVAPGQWKLWVEQVPPPPTAAQVQRSLEDIYQAMMLGERRTVSFGIIGPQEAARIREHTGLNVLLHTQELSTEYITHAFKQHKMEILPGQLPITKQDFLRYGEIMLNPQSIERGGPSNSVRFARRFPDGTVYVAEQRMRGDKLVFKTLWKQAAGGTMVAVLSAKDPEDGED